MNTPGAVGSHLCCGAWGAVGGSVPCSRAPRQSLPDLNLWLLSYESDFLTIRPRLPLRRTALQRSVMPHLRASKSNLLFEFCNKFDFIWEMICFLSKVTKHKTISDYWMWSTNSVGEGKTVDLATLVWTCVNDGRLGHIIAFIDR